MLRIKSCLNPVRRQPKNYLMTFHTKLPLLEKIKNIVTTHKISYQLVFNWDQTGIKLVPASDWTMAEEGSTQVEVRGLYDKREITALLTATLSRQLLFPQLLYAGKTPRCHPRQSFHRGWDIYHSPTHWSTEDTMLHFVKETIPYITAARECLGLSQDQKALAIFDVVTVHRVASL